MLQFFEYLVILSNLPCASGFLKTVKFPIREQLVTQIVLGIVSNDLKIAERLPSTRELARRYDIHANTVSAAYRELARRGWVEFRKGSGVYVRARNDETLESGLALDHLIARFFRNLREEGYSLAEIQTGIQRSLSMQRPDHFLLLEPDPDLREILVAEISTATKVRVKGVGPDEMSTVASRELCRWFCMVTLEEFADRHQTGDRCACAALGFDCGIVARRNKTIAEMRWLRSCRVGRSFYAGRARCWSQRDSTPMR